jgi:hypothetical protein
MKYFILKNKNGTFYRSILQPSVNDIRDAHWYPTIESAANWANTLRNDDTVRSIGNHIKCIQLITLEVTNDNIELQESLHSA